MMIDSRQDYWFFLESYIYAIIKRDEILLINTLDREKIYSKNPTFISIINSIYNKENGGVIMLTSANLGDYELLSIIQQLFDNYFCDIISTKTNPLKPFQFIPKLNIQKSIQKKYTGGVIKEEVSSYLQEVSICLNDIDLLMLRGEEIPDKRLDLNREEISLDILELIINQILNTKVNTIQIISNNIWQHTRFIKLLDILSCFPYNKIINMYYSNIEMHYSDLLLSRGFRIKLFVDFPINLIKWKAAMNLLSTFTHETEILFLITSNDNMKQIDLLFESFPFENYSFKVVHTNDNIDFFEKNVYLTEEDILSSFVSMQEIFVHQTLNTFDFGKITFTTNGDAYANIYMPKIGNIKINSINDIVYNELNKSKSWFRIREDNPCSECIYQWLCPSPSNYELVIGKPNLCHVHK